MMVKRGGRREKRDREKEIRETKGEKEGEVQRKREEVRYRGIDSENSNRGGGKSKRVDISEVSERESYTMMASEPLAALNLFGCRSCSLSFDT